jgi:hypothetical protein
MMIGCARASGLLRLASELAAPISTDDSPSQLDLEAAELEQVFPELTVLKPKTPKAPKEKKARKPSDEAYGTKNKRLVASILEAMSTGMTKRSEIMFYALSKNPDTCEYNFSNASNKIPNLVKNKGVWSLT